MIKATVVQHKIHILLLITVSFIFVPAAVDCTSISKQQELDKAVAEIGDWEALCEYLGVDKAILINLRGMINTDNAVLKHRCLQAYMNTGKACWERVVEVIAGYPFYNVRVAEKIANMHVVCSTKNEL